MKALTETTISLFELAEAEGRLLRQKVIKTASIALTMLVIAFISIIAVGLFLAAIYQGLLIISVPALAYLGTSIVCLIIIGALLWLSYYLNQDH